MVLEHGIEPKMFLMRGHKKPSLKKDEKLKDKEWENPNAPEESTDQRETEKIERQKQEAERQLNNLRDSEKENHNTHNTKNK